MTTTRRRNVFVLALVVAAGAAGAFWLAPSTRQRRAVDAVPSGAFLVATLDLARLRASPLARDLAGVREVSDVTELCGFDPLAHARSVAIAVPEKPDGVFGLAITHDLSRDALARCAERVMSARSALASVTRRGSWTFVEQRGILNDTTRAKLAYRDGAPLLVGRGDYLATMQAALDGEAPRALDAPGREGHAALRKRVLARAGEGAVLVVTALLPKSVRDRIRDEMTEGSQPTAAARKTMSGVLSVTAVSFAAALRGDDLDLFAELDCDSADACGVVRDFVDRKRHALAAQPAARFAGIGGLLDALRLDARGTSLELSLSAPEPEVVRAVRAAISAAFAPARTAPPTPSAAGFSPH